MSWKPIAESRAPQKNASETAIPAPLPGETGRSDTDPAWGLPAPDIDRWPAALAVVVAMLLYVTLPDRLTFQFGPQWQWLRWAVVAIEGALVIPLALTDMSDRWQRGTWQRPVSIGLICIVNVANLLSLIYLVDHLLRGGQTAGTGLLVGAASIWFTNILVFALWYWELDRGGPHDRCMAKHRNPDFLFPQMSTPEASRKQWTPDFVDYLYVSFTNATAFSPTDTMPLTEWAKALMMVQSAASLLTIALVFARAVNILG